MLCFLFSCKFSLKIKENSIKIVLEFMDKGTLADILKVAKKIPENILVIITVQVIM